MRRETILVVSTIIFAASAVLIALSSYHHSIATRDYLERFNDERFAGIDTYDNYFRFKISNKNGEVVFTSEPMCWEYMKQNRYVVNGELNMRETFWRSKFIEFGLVNKHFKYTIYGTYWHIPRYEFFVAWEAYY